MYICVLNVYTVLYRVCYEQQFCCEIRIYGGYIEVLNKRQTWNFISKEIVREKKWNNVVTNQKPLERKQKLTWTSNQNKTNAMNKADGRTNRRLAKMNTHTFTHSTSMWKRWRMVATKTGKSQGKSSIWDHR